MCLSCSNSNPHHVIVCLASLASALYKDKQHKIEFIMKITYNTSLIRLKLEYGCSSLVIFQTKKHTFCLNYRMNHGQ